MEGLSFDNNGVPSYGGEPKAKNLVAKVLTSNQGKCPFCGSLVPILRGDSFACSSCGRKGSSTVFMRMLGY